jgi:tetratricopeptide (TPR) repeat protein
MKQTILILTLLALCACGSRGGRKKQGRTDVVAGITTAADTLRACELYNRALEHNLQLQDAEALPLYDSAIMILPNDPDFYTNRGYTKYLLSDTPGAIADYGKALSIDSLSYGALQNMGVMCYDKGEYTSALDYTLKCVAIVDTESMHFNLGVCRYNLGDYKGAIDDFSIYLKGSHLHEALLTYYLMGNSYDRLGDMENARLNWDKVYRRGGIKAELDRSHISIELGLALHKRQPL